MSIEITEQIWSSIENTIPLFGRLKAKKISTEINLLIGVDHNRFRHILIPINDKTESITDLRSRGISVQDRLLVVEDYSESLYLDITCNYEDAHPTFNLLIADIIELLRKGLTPNEAVSSTLNKWRQFWTGGYRRILTEEQIKGLFGELWFLLVWLMPKGANTVIQWTGPSGSRHDFENETFSVEAKTTSSIRGHIHKINGIDQLELPETRILYLFSLRLRKEQTATNSLPILVDRIGTILRHDMVLFNLFESRLAQIGYYSEHTEDYNEYRYRIVDERLYIVNDSFPRLTVDQFQYGLPKGVERIDYDINLEVCPELIISKLASHWNY